MTQLRPILFLYLLYKVHLYHLLFINSITLEKCIIRHSVNLVFYKLCFLVLLVLISNAVADICQNILETPYTIKATVNTCLPHAE